MDTHRIKRDIIALALLALTVFVGISLASYNSYDPPSERVFPAAEHTTNLAGVFGSYTAYLLRNVLGMAAYLLLFLMVAMDFRLFSRKETEGFWTGMVGWSLTLVSGCVLLQLVIPAWDEGTVMGSGGYLGVMGISYLERRLSMAGSVILVLSSFSAGMILTGDIVVFRWIAKLFVFPLLAAGKVLSPLGHSDLSAEEDSATTDAIRNRPKRKPFAGKVTVKADADWEDEPEEERSPIKVNPPVTLQTLRAAHPGMALVKAPQKKEQTIELPGFELLEDPEDFPYELLAKKARVAATTLEKTFTEFGLNIQVKEIDTGPVITQFELELEAGLRLSKVTALADDLAIALRVPSVRVVPSIPGKNTVGVEVPNDKQVIVRLKELLEACPQDQEKMRIPFFMGKDVSGRPLVVDLAKLPHLLIAGRTGTGKSVCLNDLILSILMTRSPDEVRMLMIDPKMVELSPYRRIPHLMHPVITDMKKAEAVLGWAVDKMEERYDLLARCRVRHLDGFNKLTMEEKYDRLGIDPDDPEQILDAENIPEKMPYIVIVADEMADMMMTSGKDVEAHIIRLAQKSRAVGIHLILATQKPTVDVITGLIKSNLPARISFQVASRTDSRVVLDEMGAERLLGNGDMLYLAPGTSKVSRAQGAFVGDDEINAVIDFYSEYEPQYSTELAQLSASTKRNGKNDNSGRMKDDLYEQAIETVVREGRGSVSLLQRALGIGYGRGARLIDYMAEDGIVGDYNGSQAREVLYTQEQWEAFQEEQIAVA